MIRATLYKTGIPDAPVKQLRIYTAQTFEEIGDDWKKEVMPGHFKRGAARKYKYHPRATSTQNRKRRQGSKPALVDKGKARRMAMADRRPSKVTGRGKKVTVRVKLPRHMFNIPKGKYTKRWPHRPADEVTRVAEKEVGQMQNRLVTGIADKYNNNKFLTRRVL